MKVKITDPKTPEGMTSELFFDLDCNFIYDEEQYGKKTYLSIASKDGHFENYYDLRYDMTFDRNEKEKWLEKWARSYWSGENGAWTIKTLEIEKV